MSRRINGRRQRMDSDLRRRAAVGKRSAPTGEQLPESASHQEELASLRHDLAKLAESAFRTIEVLLGARPAAARNVKSTAPPLHCVEDRALADSLTDRRLVTSDPTEHRRYAEYWQRSPSEQDATLGAGGDGLARLHDELTEMRGALEVTRKTLERERAQRLRLQEEAAENYKQLKRRLLESIKEVVPASATVAVVSKGDEDLVRLRGRRGWHFPQGQGAVYAGHYPADSGEAIAHLEELRRKGAQYLVLPATAKWWLDHYSDFADHLARRYRRVMERDDVGVIVDLRRARAGASDWKTRLDNLLEEFQTRFGATPAVLDCQGALRLEAAFPGHTVFSAPDDGTALPYLDATVDVVVCAARSPLVDEARRVARALFVTTTSGSRDTRAGQRPVRLHAEWLLESERTPPAVSIIIPCYNAARLTDDCLSAVEATLPASFEGEIIVVDDASTDATPGMLTKWTRRRSRVKILRNRRNLGFLRSCNRAARAARGEILVLLNNDTRPCRGWLTALLRTFEDHPDAGAVGGKLVFPDGTLQEAGGVVFRDGSALHFGRGDRNPDHPLFNFVRTVDYCSAALLATPRRLFLEIGGFDSKYLPAYYEDTDYCFKLRDKGLHVYYQPAARVVHHEGVSCGTDVKTGVKQYQILNQRKFRERWKSALRRRPERPHQENRAVWHQLAVAPRAGRP